MSCGAASCNRNNCPKLLWVVSEHLNGHSDVTFMIEKIGFEVLCRHYEVTYVTSSDDRWRRLEVASGLSKSSTFGPKEDSSPSCTPPTDTCSSKDTVEDIESFEWLKQFDVLLALATPFDRLDRTIRLLPPGFNLNRTVDRPQRRAVYFLGFDPRYLPHYNIPVHESDTLGGAHLNQSSPSPSPSLSAPQTFSFLHYDIIWYRSTYELSLLINAGFIPDYFRTIHCFGVGDYAALDPIGGGGEINCEMHSDRPHTYKAHTSVCKYHPWPSQQGVVVGGG